MQQRERKRLGGWVRLGIVASVLWAIGGSFFLAKRLDDSALDFRALMDQSCYAIREKDPSYDIAGCLEQNNRAAQSERERVWPNALMATLIPIPIVWLLVWLTVVVFRWVRTGFK
jgi:hypothetical protein